MITLMFFSLIAFFAVVLFCIGIYLYMERLQDDKIQSQRLDLVVNNQMGGSFIKQESVAPIPIDSSESTLRRDKRISTIPWLDNILGQFLKDNSKFLMNLIEQSGLKIRVGEFLLFTLIVGFLGATIVDSTLNIPLLGFAACALPFWILSFLKEKRIDAFTAQLPQAMDMLSGDLRAGLDVLAGLKNVSEEFSFPLGEEFEKVVVEVNLGLSLNDALLNLARRVNTMDVQILCTGMIINREMGGNLSEIISTVAATVRERFKLKGVIKSLTAENRMSGLLLTALPFGLYVILNILAPDTYNYFIGDPTGKLILAGCIVSTIVGYVAMEKITKLDV